MVWGLKIQCVFNEFFPDGDYIGYKEALDTYYEHHAQPDEMKDGPYGGAGYYRRRVKDKFHDEIGVPRLQPGEPPLTPIKPHEWPTVFKLRKTRTSMGSLIALNDRIYAVDDALKSVIERLEPGVHQFNPIRILMPKDVEYPVPYHVMVVRRWLDSFRPNESDPDCLYSPGKSLFPKDDKKQCYAGVAMSSSVIGDAHLWRERELRGPQFFMSDPLQVELASRGLRVPKHFKMKSV